MTEYASLSLSVDSRDAEKATRSLNDLIGASDRATKGIDLLGRAALALGTALSVKSFIDVGREIENASVRMRFLTSSTEEAAKATDALKSFAARVPFEFREITNAAPNLLVVAKNTEELNRLLEITGDIAAVSGLSFEQTAQQLQRAMSAGISSADLFRDRGVAAMLGFQQGVTVSAEETKKKITDLWFGAEGATNSLKGAGDEMAKTWDGITSMLSDKWFLFQSKVMDSGPFEFLKASMAEVDARLQANFGSIEHAAEATGGVIVTMIEDIVKSGAIVVDVLSPPLALIADATGDMWRGYKSLPEDVQSVGLVGALLFGKKGLAVLGAASYAINNISEITNLIDEQKIAKQLAILDERIELARSVLKNAEDAFQEGYSEAANRGEGTDILVEQLTQAQNALADLERQRAALVNAPIPTGSILGTDPEEVGETQSKVEEFFGAVRARIEAAAKAADDLRARGGITGVGTNEDEKTREKALKALEDERKAIQAIVDATNPYQAKQRELIAQIAILDAAIKKETGSTDQLTKAKAVLERQLDDLRNATRDAIKGHEDTVEQLTKELEALRQGEDAYRRFTIEQEISEETRRRIAELQATGIELTDAEISQISNLTRAEIQLRDQIDREAQAREDANRAWQGFVTEVAGAFIDSTGSMGDAISDLLSRGKRELINSGLAALFGFQQGSTPILSGLSHLFGGGGAAAGGGGFSLSNLFSAGTLLPGAQANVLNATSNLAMQGGLVGSGGLLLNNAANTLSGAPGGLVGGGLLSAGAGFLGGQIGAGVFGQAGTLSQLGGLGGTIGGAALGSSLGWAAGPLGALAGSFVGSALDSVFGGDGPERRAAVFVGANAGRAEQKHTVADITTDSGLRLAGEAQRVGEEGRQAVLTMTDALVSLDAALTQATRQAGFSVDLAGADFGRGGFAPGAESARDFVRAWIDNVSRGFDAELEMAAASLGGDSAEQLAAGFEALLNINSLLDSGGELFAGVTGLAETIGLLQGRFAEAGEGLTDTMLRLDTASALLRAVGEETDNTVEFFERASRALKGLGADRAAQITRFGDSLQRVTDLLSGSRVVADYEAQTRSLFETYQLQSEQIAELAQNLGNEASFAALETALLARYNTELQLIGQIDSALQSVTASFGSTIDNLVLDGLKTEQERYQFFRQQADNLAEEILSLSDPAQIEAGVAEYNRLVNSAFQALGEETRDLMRDDVISTVTEMRDLTTALLEDLRTGVTSGGDQDVAATIRSETQTALAQLRQAVQEAVATVAQQQAETSRQSTQLVQSLNQWAASLPESIRVQIAGTEVAF